MSEAALLEGKLIKEKLIEELRKECAKLKIDLSRSPKLVALKAGTDAGTDMYITSQSKACGSVGVKHEVRALDGNISTEKVIEEIEKLNRDASVDGVIIQMPLPKQVNADQVLSSLSPLKDAEGVHPHNLGLLFMGRPVTLPCTPAACVELIKSSGIDLYGKEVVVAGTSVAVGKPISILLLDQMATVTMCRSSASKVGSLERHVRAADVLIAAIGQPEAIRGNWIKEGAIVIDVGTNRVNGKTVGDVEFEPAKKRAKMISPVPGGVGPVTTAILIRNVLRMAKKRHESMRPIGKAK